MKKALILSILCLKGRIVVTRRVSECVHFCNTFPFKSSDVFQMLFVLDAMLPILKNAVFGEFFESCPNIFFEGCPEISFSFLHFLKFYLTLWELLCLAQVGSSIMDELINATFFSLSGEQQQRERDAVLLQGVALHANCALSFLSRRVYKYICVWRKLLCHSGGSSVGWVKNLGHPIPPF